MTDTATGATHADTLESRQQEVRRLRSLATALDSSIPLPGGYRVGLDGLIGLVPVVGDGLAAGLSTYIVIKGARLGLSTTQIIRMLLNIVVELVVGAIPLVGDIFDFVWKANERNLSIIEKHVPIDLPESGSQTRISRAGLIVLAFFVLLAFALLVLVARLLRALLAVPLS